MTPASSRSPSHASDCRRPLADIERPSNTGQPFAAWGSDAAAETLRALDLEYIALNPGFSFRGLHDSLVNHLGNRNPQIILCLHEDHAIAIAHAYAKVTGRPMAVALHSNVGLMHGTMAVFNAFCDRAPIVMIGGTGPLDAASRRPWIDWLHTSADQAALIRPFSKWDDQPGSVDAAVASILRAHQLATTEPCAPVYVCLDVQLQEQRLDEPPRIPDAVAFGASPRPPHPHPESVAEVVTMIQRAKLPVLLAGRGSRDQAAWDARVRLAEDMGAQVFTHRGLPAAFPTGHPCFAGCSGLTGMTERLKCALESTDLVLSLDWLDLGGTLERVWGAGVVAADVVSVSLDQHLHHGWTKDECAPAPATIRIACDPDAMVMQLVERIDRPVGQADSAPGRRRPQTVQAIPATPDAQLRTAHVVAGLRAALDGGDATLVSVSGRWAQDLWPFSHPLDYLGADGGGGIGSGPGMAVGAALALHGTDRLAVAVLGDGDFAMGVTALWTAAHYRLPLLIAIANNRSFLNDELHQHRMAQMRGRPIENRWIGERIEDPPLDNAGLARAQGALGIGPIKDLDALGNALSEAVTAARAGAVVVVDVWVANEPDTPCDPARHVGSGGAALKPVLRRSTPDGLSV